MNLLQSWVQTPAASALGWTLAASLWEGAVAALVLALALALLRSSRARYAAACLAMLGLLCSLGLTFTRMMPQPVGQPILAAAAFQAAFQGDSFAHPFRSHYNAWVERRAADYLPWLAPIWIAGVLLFHIRSLIGWMAARRLRRIGVVSAPEVWQARLDRLRARLRLSKPVTLFESCLAEGPAVMGYLRPVILMPVGLLAGLPAGQLEAILLHELAHIRRRDYLVNLFQIFVEGLLFYHPAVWWISSQIRAERENCCDDLVVGVTGAAFEYATALEALEQNRSAPREALAASGGSLVQRIRRLLAQPEPHAKLTPVLAAAILTITVVTAVVAWQPPPPVPATGPYQKWLTQDVAYIITGEEKQAWALLSTDEERKQFIGQFWLRRDPTPGTPQNEFQEEHYRRIAYANQHFWIATIAGWKTDRGRIYITYGPPDQIEAHPFGSESDYPFQEWRYRRHIEGLGDDAILLFLDQTWSADYRLTTNPSDKHAPQGNPVTGRISSLGATVQMRDETQLISVPMDSYPGHHLKLVGHIVSGTRGPVEFEDGVEGQTSPYTKVVKLRPGSYQLKLTVKDVTTGAVGAQEIEFEVK